MGGEVSIERRMLGKALRATRAEVGVGQEETSRRAGLSRHTVGRIERGEVDATVGTLRAIARALDVQPSAVLALAERYEREAAM